MPLSRKAHVPLHCWRHERACGARALGAQRPGWKLCAPGCPHRVVLGQWVMWGPCRVGPLLLGWHPQGRAVGTKAHPLSHQASVSVMNLVPVQRSIQPDDPFAVGAVSLPHGAFPTLGLMGTECSLSSAYSSLGAGVPCGVPRRGGRGGLWSGLSGFLGPRGPDGGRGPTCRGSVFRVGCRAEAPGSLPTWTPWV